MLQIADDSSGGISSAINNSLKQKGPGELDRATVDRMLDLLYPHIFFAREQNIRDAAGNLVEAEL